MPQTRKLPQTFSFSFCDETFLKDFSYFDQHLPFKYTIRLMNCHSHRVQDAAAPTFRSLIHLTFGLPFSPYWCGLASLSLDLRNRRLVSLISKIKITKGHNQIYLKCYQTTLIPILWLVKVLLVVFYLVFVPNMYF